jgi:hypothetical protein
MVRRTDRPRRKVRVSFEATRFGSQHLIDAYAGLVPTIRRERVQAKLGTAQPPRLKAMSTKMRKGEP